jgi:hypothetical protein
MANDFEWLTDSDEQPPDPGESSRSRRFFSRRIRLVFSITLLVLLSVAVASFIWLRDRSDQTTGLAREEVSITHRLYQEAVALRDYDLIQTMLTNSDPSWREKQLDLVDRHLHQDRGLLRIVSDDQPSHVDDTNPITITLSPDFESALVTELQPYQFKSTAASPGAVKLERTYQYHRTEQGWVPAPLPEGTEFWGKWMEIKAQDLSIVMPARDADIVETWLNPLNQLVQDICNITEVACPSDFHLELQFERDSDSIFRLSESYPHSNLFPFRSRYHLELPAPTIVGRSLDPSSKEALYQGYAGLVATVLFASYAESGDQLADIEPLLRRVRLEAPPAPPVLLPRPPEVIAGARQELPSEDLLMLCSRSSTIDLLRLKTDSLEWEDEWLNFDSLLGTFPQNYGAYLTPAPNHKGTLLHLNEADQGSELWRTYWWYNDQMTMLLSDEVPYFVWPPSYHNDINKVGRFIRVIQDNQTGEIQEFTTSWFDVGECLAGPCQIQSVTGFPIWSKDGNHTLVVRLNHSGQTSLYLGDQMGQPLEFLGIGSSPFWINDTQFGYIRPVNVTLEGQVLSEDGEEIVTGWIPGESDLRRPVKTVANTDIIQQLLPPDVQTGPIRIMTVMINPEKPDSWIIAAIPSESIGNRNSLIFELDLEAQELALLLSLGNEQLEMPIFTSPDDRFLSVVTSDENESNLYILDLSTDRITKSNHGFPSDWSSDGRWMLFFEEGNPLLFAPETDQELDIPLDIPGCYSAVWTAQE